MKHDTLGSVDAVRADNTVMLTWHGDRRFEAGRAGGPTIRMDGDTTTAPSPVDALISALAGCTAVDVVDILKKRRTEPTALEIVVTAERSDGTPRRVVKVHLSYRITGGGVEHDHALRAIDLAVTKYCSVRDSLDPELPVTWSLDILPG
ncbi:MAG: OsmC family protein [bacterium]|jgi:putative redox protein